MEEIISKMLKQSISFPSFIKAFECCYEGDEKNQNRSNCDDCPFEYTDGTACCWIFEEGTVLMPTLLVKIATELMKHARDIELRNLYCNLTARKDDALLHCDKHIELGLDELETVLNALKWECMHETGNNED